MQYPYIELKDQRINLQQVAHYYPGISTSGSVNRFSIIFVLSGGAVLNVAYDNIGERNSDLEKLDKFLMTPHPLQ